MYKISGKQIREIRNKIMQGYPVDVLADMYKVSDTTIRNYTKYERQQMKIKRKIS